MPKALRPHRRHRHPHHTHTPVAGSPNHRAPGTTPIYPREPVAPSFIVGSWALGVALIGLALYFGLMYLAASDHWPDSLTNFASLAVIFSAFIALGYMGLIGWRQHLRYLAAYRLWERAVAKLDRADQRAADAKAQAWHAVKQQLGLGQEGGRHRRRVRSVQDLDINWQEFEQLAGFTYQRLGYTVSPLSQQGVDGLHWHLLAPDGQAAVVLCRYWQAPLDEPQVSQWFQTANSLGASQLVLWSLKGFSQSAWDTYEESPAVRLYDVYAMDALIEKAYGLADSNSQPNPPALTNPK